MTKISKVMQYIALSGLLLSLSIGNVAAFGFLPPMPGEPVNDPVTNVNKMFAYGQDVYNQTQTHMTQLKTLNLTSLKGFTGNLGFGNKAANRPELKTPGLGEFKGFNAGGVSVSSDSTNEEDYYNMYYALFFTYPDADDAGDNKFEVLKTAYKHKAKEYKQDVIVNTYVASRYTEDYLATIDATLVRLNDCVKGEKTGDACKFFGMQVVKPAEPEAKEPQEGENGQLGVAMNMYIVTTIYDRILRIVEDLTATEAIFKAAQQLDAGKPISESKEDGQLESNAADYINNNMRFAYSDYNDNTYAVALISKTKRSTKCNGKASANCPNINDDVADIKSVEDASILRELKDLDTKVTQVVELHNLKSRLHEYKTQYRQYLMLKQIQQEAFKVLKTSDQCAIDFLRTHLSLNDKIKAPTIWYGGEMNDTLRNEYDKRAGLSAWLIEEYNDKSTQMAIGTSTECDGYYEVCPAGYEKDEEHKCLSNGTEFYACVVKMVTQDQADAEKGIKIDDWKETDGFINGADSEVIQTEGRKQAELTWAIGRDGVMKFMTENDGQFKLWNDQKVFQAEYLRQKYRNIRLIVESADIGKLSYKIGTVKAGNDETPDNVGLSSIIKHIAVCQDADTAVQSAKNKYCNGASSAYCEVSKDNGNIVTKKYVLKNGKKELMAGYPIIESQKVSVNDTCIYKKEATLENIDSAMNNSGFCFTPSCLVKKFYPAVLGENEEIFANNDKRITAADYLADVVNTRKDEEDNLRDWIKGKVTVINNLKQDLTKLKGDLIEINKSIDTARVVKNSYKAELDRAEARLNIIDMEINEQNNRKNQLATQPADQKVIADKIAKLNDEALCIRNKKTQCADYIKNKPSNETTPQNGEEKLYMKLVDAKAGMDKKDIEIKSYQSRLNGYNDKIKDLEDKIEDETGKFADKYIIKAEKVQKAIEDKNDEFENFLEAKNGNKQSYRMKTKQKTICYDKKPLNLGCKKNGRDFERLESENVATTLQKVVYYKGNLDEAIKQGLNDKFFSDVNKSNMASLLQNIGIPSNFHVDDTFTVTAINLAAGSVNIATLVEKSKDALVEAAKTKLNEIITKSDNIAVEEIEEAKIKIRDFTSPYNLDGNTSNPPHQRIYDVSEYNNLRAKHLDLIENLRKPKRPETRAAGITDLSEVFGIPTKSELKDMLGTKEDIADDEIYDSAYFVGLPARGNIYQGKTDDENAGRDYMPPKSPMAGLPPLREVFYFSAADYNEIPQDKHEKPVLSHLLNCKYTDTNGDCTEEYLPEIWLHLLARPNWRKDGKYQQTFVERSFSQDNINKLVKNEINNMAVPGAKPEHYRAIIGRSGVYPCKADNVIVDVDGGNNVTNIQFMKRNNNPTGLSRLPTCQEVTTKIGNICNSKSGTLCHKLADHNNTNVNDTQKLGNISTHGLYENYSELGQLLTEDLAYNPLQKNIQKYLQDKGDDNTKNDITRQKAERASFKRNVMGSFLNAVIAEDKARKALEQNEKDIKSRLNSLCQQIHTVGIFLNDKNEAVNDCADTLMKKGMASSINDDKYDVNCAALKNNTSYYEQIFCKLDGAKEDNLASVVKAKANYEKGGYELVVQEKLDEIENLINALDNDGDEVTTIRPDTDASDMHIETAKIDRNLAIEKAEEGLVSMQNQTQSAAYCPIY